MHNPDTALTLYPSRRKWLLVTIIGLVFVAAGILIVADGDAGGWLAIGFFGLVALVGIVSMLPSASYLRLTPEGLRVSSLYRSYCVPWQSITGFGQTSMHHNTFVSYHIAAEARAEHKTGHDIARALSGYDAALPDTYGKHAEDLIELLEQWRTRYS